MLVSVLLDKSERVEEKSGQCGSGLAMGRER